MRGLISGVIQRTRSRLRHDGTGEVKILVCHHKPGPSFRNEVFVPVQVGRAIAQTILDGMTGDDTGRNISELNETYCELTALYWMRHNLNADFYGLAHYRRLLNFGTTADDHFGDLSGETIDKFGWTPARVRAECKGWDILTATKSSVAPLTVLEQYRHCHNGNDLAIAAEAIKCVSPNLTRYADAVFKAQDGFFCNLMVMRRDYFIAYADWLFAVLSFVESRISLSSYDAYQRRVFGFLAERLLNVYVEYLIAHKGARHKQMPMCFGQFV